MPGQADLSGRDVGAGPYGFPDGRVQRCPGWYCASRRGQADAQQRGQVGRCRVQAAGRGQRAQVPAGDGPPAGVPLRHPVAGRRRHLERRVGQAERRADPLGHQRLIRRPSGLPEQVAEQAVPVVGVGVGVRPGRGAQRPAGGPDQPGVGIARVGIAQMAQRGPPQPGRQPRQPRGVGSQIGQGYRARPPGQVADRGLGQPHLTAFGHVGEQQRGEDLGQRPDLEDGPRASAAEPAEGRVAVPHHGVGQGGNIAPADQRRQASVGPGVIALARTAISCRPHRRRWPVRPCWPDRLRRRAWPGHWWRLCSAGRRWRRARPAGPRSACDAASAPGRTR